VASVASTSTLEAAAQQHGLTVERTPSFTRGSFVPGLGQLNEAVGAAFAIPVGSVGAPVRTNEAVFVLRVDRRVRADSAAFQAELPNLRQQRLMQVRQQRVQMYLRDLRESARVDDRRQRIQAALRRQEV
jgi:peptidyl-prolyl cis-trans isomerase D